MLSEGGDLRLSQRCGHPTFLRQTGATASSSESAFAHDNATYLAIFSGQVGTARTIPAARWRAESTFVKDRRGTTGRRGG